MIKINDLTVFNLLREIRNIEEILMGEKIPPSQISVKISIEIEANYPRKGEEEYAGNTK